jgi:hypothetical protein
LSTDKLRLKKSAPSAKSVRDKKLKYQLFMFPADFADEADN